jgi:4-hydroxybenzoate polyprenyltransferase
VQLRTLDQLLKFRFALFDAPATLAGGLIAVIDPVVCEGLRWPTWSVWLYILLAATFARSAAMAFNEFLDRHFDAANGRTALRAIPTKRATPGLVLALSIAFALLFLLICFLLGPLIFGLAPLLLLLLFGYSYLKRVTAFCHLVLGVVIGLGPVMAAAVVSSHLSPAAVWLGSALFTSIAANDILYATLDLDFDRRMGLYSIPAKWGLVASRRFALALHLVTTVSLVGAGRASFVGPLYWVGIAAVALYLAYHHVAIRRGANLFKAFIWCNKVVAVGIFASVLGGLLWHG